MLDTRLTEEQQSLRKTVEAFTREVVAPVSYAHDRDKSFPYEVVRGMAEMGLFGLPFPEEYGGMGGDYFALCLAIEELARVDQSVAITLEAGCLARRDADLPLRHRGAEAAVAPAAVLGRRRSAPSGSPSRAPAATPAAPAPPPGSRTARGSSTAARRSSPTAAPTSPGW